MLKTLLSRLGILEVALTISLLLHGLLLSVHFVPPPPRAQPPSRLDVILVNPDPRIARKPRDEHVQAYAQVDQDGGGNTEEDRRFSSNQRPTADLQDGEFDSRRLRQRQEELESSQQTMLELYRKKGEQIRSAEKREQKDSPKTQQEDSADLIESYKRMAAAMAMDERIEAYNKIPRRSRIEVFAKSLVGARYQVDLGLKIERIGTLNYPAAAKGGSYSLIVTTLLDRDGSIVELKIEKSSGRMGVDEAATRIIRMGAPYPPLPPEFLRQYDQLIYTRTITFTSQGSINVNNR